MPANPAYFDVATLLSNNGFGALGSGVFGGEWGDPDAQILVVEAPGVPAAQPDIYEQPAVQILVRGEKRGRDVDVYRVAKSVYDFIVTRPESTEILGTCYKGFEPGSNLAPLGKDSNERFVYSMNFYTWRNGAEGP